MSGQGIGWPAIVRLGLVQMSLGAIVVLMTSTINRVMVVELALPAVIPGALLTIHYAVQMLRPRWGYGSDMGGRRTPWIVGGMATLALGGFLAAVATALAGTQMAAGLALAVLAFVLVGMGAGAAGTTLLVVLATRVDPARRAAAATVVWIMMIAGFAVTAPLAGHFLDPYSPARLVAVTGTVCVIAFAVSLVGIWGAERQRATAPAAAGDAGHRRTPFLEALREVWSEPASRQFVAFIFISMLAYSAQELILEPFAGLVFSMTPGQSTKLAGFQHGGVLAGMILVSLATTVIGGPRLGSLRGWTVAGCLGSGLALVAIALGGAVGPDWPLRTFVFLLGLCNGAYAASAIGSMMGLASNGAGSREGTRMGLFGAAQGIAMGLGGFMGTVASDIARWLLGSAVAAYGTVFVLEAGLFVVAAVLASRIGSKARLAPASAGQVSGRLAAGRAG